MSQTNQALKAAEQLSPKLRRQLALRLLAGGAVREKIVLLHQLSAEKQERLGVLLEKNNEGELTPAERVHLKRLGAAADQIMLANSKALAKSLRPEVFDRQGRLVKKRLRST